MIQGLYAIKDELSGYASPITIKNDELAMRWFTTQVNSNEMMKESAKDFSLWKIGEFNTESGLVVGEPLNELKLIIRAESVVKND